MSSVKVKGKVMVKLMLKLKLKIVECTATVHYGEEGDIQWTIFKGVVSKFQESFLGLKGRCSNNI